MLTDVSYANEIAEQAKPFVKAANEAHPKGVSADVEYIDYHTIALHYDAKPASDLAAAANGCWVLRRMDECWVVDQRRMTVELKDGTLTKSVNFLSGESEGVVADMLAFYAFSNSISRFGCEECAKGECKVDHVKAGFDVLKGIVGVAETNIFSEMGEFIDLTALWAEWRTTKVLDILHGTSVLGMMDNSFVALRKHFRDYGYTNLRIQRKDNVAVFLRGPEHAVGVRFELDKQDSGRISKVVILEGDKQDEELSISGDDKQAHAIFYNICRWYEEITGEDAHNFIEILQGV